MLKKTLAAWLAIGALSMMASAQAGWFSSDDKPAALPAISLQSGLMMPQAKSINFFTQQLAKNHQAFYFTDQNGQAFGAENLQKRWTLVFFGFTYCPMLCPTTLAQLNNAYQQLQAQKFEPLPQIVFVSVDPERDKQAQVKKFIDAFNSQFIGIRTDDQAALAEFSRELDAAYEKVKGSGKDKDRQGDYTITHTGDIAMINPKGQLVAMLTMPHSDKNIAADYQAIVKKLS
jgi:protein SCO1/2